MKKQIWGSKFSKKGPQKQKKWENAQKQPILGMFCCIRATKSVSPEFRRSCKVVFCSSFADQDDWDAEKSWNSVESVFLWQKWLTYRVFQIGILVYTDRQVTGLVSSYSDIKWTPTGWASWLDILWQEFQAKTWHRISFNLKPHEYKIFRSWTYFMLPFVSEEYEAHLAIMMIWWWWWLIRERAYDNNIRKILKYFQKQRLWWEHRNILEKLRNHIVLRRDLLKVLQSCQNKR